MLSLSAKHLEEIASYPELNSLVEGSVVRDCNVKSFFHLCVLHNCTQTVVDVSPGILNILSRHNGVAMAQGLDLSKEHPKVWKRAARHAGEGGHIEFVEYILTQLDNDSIRKSVVTGACMGDNVALVQRFASTIEDPTFSSHLPPFAVQFNAFECLQYLLKDMKDKVWMNTMSVALLEAKPKMMDLLLDHIPLDFAPPKSWCAKIAMEAAKINSQRVLDLVFQQITDQQIIQWYPKMSLLTQGMLTSAYQRRLLTVATSDVDGLIVKRKM